MQIANWHAAAAEAAAKKARDKSAAPAQQSSQHYVKKNQEARKAARDSYNKNMHVWINRGREGGQTKKNDLERSKEQTYGTWVTTKMHTMKTSLNVESRDDDEMDASSSSTSTRQKMWECVYEGHLV